MNKRIEHCLYQAGLTAQGCWDELDDYAKEGIEKFAELIVKEILVTCEAHPAWTGRMIGEQIKQHFGVEE
jgi:metal-sulfur cluster biosynthetic enzyme